MGIKKTVYPGWKKRDFILNVISKEEDQFNKTIDQGLGILAEMEGENEKGETVLSGDHAFKLYDTLRISPSDKEEILEEKGISVDEEGFRKRCRYSVRRPVRQGVTNYMGADVTVYSPSIRL